MAELRKFISTSPLILVAIGISAAAVGVLFTFPQNPLIWQAATWTLVAALFGLLALVLVSGYALVTEAKALLFAAVASVVRGKPKFWSRATDAGNTLDKPIDLGLAVRIWTSRILPGVILPPGATQFPGEPDESRSAA